MIKGSIDSIETLGLVDGPGIRVVVFLNGCKLRCRYCHNPEMWEMREGNYTPEELVRKLVRYKTYFRERGGVTFSGGEPLLQSEFLLEVLPLLKQENIHVSLDTAGVGIGEYQKILSYVDLIIFDIKHVTEEGYFHLTGHSMDESLRFVEVANKMNKPFWIRQVVVPGMMDQKEYLDKLKEYLKKFKNVTKIEFLPYHKLGSEKYFTLGIPYPYEKMPEMDKEICDSLYKEFMKTI